MRFFFLLHRKQKLAPHSFAFSSIYVLTMLLLSSALFAQEHSPEKDSNTTAIEAPAPAKKKPIAPKAKEDIDSGKQAGPGSVLESDKGAQSSPLSQKQPSIIKPKPKKAGQNTQKRKQAPLGESAQAPVQGLSEWKQGRDKASKPAARQSLKKERRSKRDGIIGTIVELPSFELQLLPGYQRSLDEKNIRSGKALEMQALPSSKEEQLKEAPDFAKDKFRDQGAETETKLPSKRTIFNALIVFALLLGLFLYRMRSHANSSKKKD